MLIEQHHELHQKDELHVLRQDIQGKLQSCLSKIHLNYKGGRMQLVTF